MNTLKFRAIYDPYGGILTIEEDGYRDAGWYIETTPKGEFTVFEFNDNEPRVISVHKNFRLALLATERLT